MDEIDELESGTRAAHRDERRRSLVLAAYQLIAEKGFEHLRTRDVAARAGVNIATLHYYFAHKEDLIRGVVDHLLSEFRTLPASGPVIENTTPLGLIRSMFMTTYYRFQAMPEMFIVLIELVLRSLRDTSIQPAIHLLDEGWHAYLTYLLIQGMQQGTFRADLDPEDMASRLIMLIKGFSMHRITSPQAVDPDYILKDVERLLLA